MAETSNQALAEPASAPASAPAARPAVFDRLSAAPGVAGQTSDIGMVMDIPVQLTVQLGRARLPIRDILAQGSVVELDGLAGEPLDVYVNGCLIAQGEVVVVNEKFGIRLTDIVTPAERARKLAR